jgi:hypothetical protein
VLLLSHTVALRDEQCALLKWIRFFVDTTYHVCGDDVDARSCTKATYVLYGEW